MRKPVVEGVGVFNAARSCMQGVLTDYITAEPAACGPGGQEGAADRRGAPAVLLVSMSFLNELGLVIHLAFHSAAQELCLLQQTCLLRKKVLS